jgi:hypothetical protein
VGEEYLSNHVVGEGEELMPLKSKWRDVECTFLKPRAHIIFFMTQYRRKCSYLYTSAHHIYMVSSLALANVVL